MTDDQKIDAFETTLRASHEWVSSYAEKLGNTHPPLAFSCLRAALHIIRDRLPASENAHFAAQLPMLLRGAYYEGWRPGHKARRFKGADDVLQELSRDLAEGLAAPPRDVMRALFELLEERIAEGEVTKLRHILPQPIREMWGGSDTKPDRADDAIGSIH